MDPTTTVLEVLCDEKPELRMRGLCAQLRSNSLLVDDPAVAQDQSAAKLRTSEPSCQSNEKLFPYLQAVLRIRDICVRIRIRIRTSDYGIWIRIRLRRMYPALDPAIFVRDLQDGNKKLFFFLFFCLLPFEATFTSFLKDKSS